MKRFCVLLLVVLGLSLAPACGGGGAGAGVLAGTWFGPRDTGGAISITFDGRGHVEQYSLDGTPTGTEGVAVLQRGRYYLIGFADDGVGTFLLSEDEDHAGYVHNQHGYAALQRGATTWSDEAFVLEDITNRNYGGQAYFVNREAYVVEETTSRAGVLTDATYFGSDDRGRMFQSPDGTAMTVRNALTGIFEGPYEDQFQPTNGVLEFLMTPDRQFVFATGYWSNNYEDGWFATWSLAERPPEPDPDPDPDPDPPTTMRR